MPTTRIELIKPYNGMKAGEVFLTDGNEAHRLIEQGVAKKAGVPVSPFRGRRQDRMMRPARNRNIKEKSL